MEKYHRQIARLTMFKKYYNNMQDKDILLKLASKISYERKKRNLSQEKLAEMANVNMRSISMIENGTTNAKFLTLYKIANALNIEVCELVNFHL